MTLQLPSLDVVDGTRLHREERAPTGPARGAVLFCHGFAEHCGRYLPLAEHLAAQGFHCFLFDFRGHGRSEGRRGHVFSFEEYLHDFTAARRWATTKSGGLPLFIAAHSYGGLVSLHGVARDASGLAGLALSSPFFGYALQVPRLKVLAARQLSRLLPAFALPTGLDARMVSHDPAVVQHYATDPLITQVATGRWFTETEGAQARLPDAARQVRVPVLLQMAGDDRIASAATARQIFDELAAPDRTFQEYPGFFHEIWFELERQRPIDALTTWLQAHLPTEKAQ